MTAIVLAKEMKEKVKGKKGNQIARKIGTLSESSRMIRLELLQPCHLHLLGWEDWMYERMEGDTFFLYFLILFYTKLLWLWDYLAGI